MHERGQATTEYAGICLLAALLVLALVQQAQAHLREAPANDAGSLELARRYEPIVVPERGDGEQPVDFRRCRAVACARGARPVLYVHVVRRPGATYVEYWEYLPDSRTAHTGIPMFDGYHRDDWEGVIATRMAKRIPPALVPQWLHSPTSHAGSPPGRPSPATSARTSRS